MSAGEATTTPATEKPPELTLSEQVCKQVFDHVFANIVPAPDIPTVKYLREVWPNVEMNPNQANGIRISPYDVLRVVNGNSWLLSRVNSVRLRRINDDAGAMVQEVQNLTKLPTTTVSKEIFDLALMQGVEL